MPKKLEAAKKNPNNQDHLPPRANKLKAVARMTASAQSKEEHSFHPSELEKVTFTSGNKSETFNVFHECDLYEDGFRVQDKYGKKVRLDSLLITGYYDCNNYVTDDELLEENKQVVLDDLKEFVQDYKNSLGVDANVEIVRKKNVIIEEPLTISSSSSSTGSFGEEPLQYQVISALIIPENVEDKAQASLNTTQRDPPVTHDSKPANDQIEFKDELDETSNKLETEDKTNPADRLPEIQQNRNDTEDSNNAAKPVRVNKPYRKKRQRLNKKHEAYEARKAEGRPAGDESRIDWGKLRREIGKQGIKEKKRAYEKKIAENIQRYRSNQTSLNN